MNAIFLVLVALPAALVSFVLEGRRKNTASPKDLTYTWGFFQGMSGLLLGFYCLLLGGYLASDGRALSLAGPLLVYGAITAPAGYFVIKRRKWAWVVHTIASFNPVWWIANSIYGRNRWDEFDRGSGKPALNAYGLPLGQRPDGLQSQA
jgi:hypothetical protein